MEVRKFETANMMKTPSLRRLRSIMSLKALVAALLTGTQPHILSTARLLLLSLSLTAPSSSVWATVAATDLMREARLARALFWSS